MMRSTGYIHPEWGYLAPTLSFFRRLCAVVVGTAAGAGIIAAAIWSLIERPATGSNTDAFVTSTTKPVTAHRPQSLMHAQGPSATPLVDNSLAGEVVSPEANTISTEPQPAPDASASAEQSPAQAPEETINDTGAVVARIKSAMPARDFIFSDSDRRLLSASDVAHLSPAALRIARNEIFARRGQYFDSNDLKRRFGSFVWYHPHTWNPRLNAIERQNLRVILDAERRR